MFFNVPKIITLFYKSSSSLKVELSDQSLFPGSAPILRPAFATLSRPASPFSKHRPRAEEKKQRRAFRATLKRRGEAGPSLLPPPCLSAP